MTDWVYDIETYPNIFSVVFNDTQSSEGWIFEISDRRDDSKALRKFMARLYRNKDRMIGFNNIGFDYPVIHFMLKNPWATYSDIYDRAMDVIFSEDKFAYLVREKDMFVPQIDLYKINHFDNKARATSLKMLEFNMLSDNIEDLPFEPGTRLSDDEKDVLIKYNKHDVFQTYEFWKECKGAITFREELSKKYNRNFLNHNDTKIGKDYFIMELEKNNPGCCYKQTKKGRKMNQTHRKQIDMKDVVFDYIKFDRPEFEAVRQWFLKQTITETKGVFSDILESDLGELAKYAEMVTKKKKLKDKPTEQEIAEIKQELPLAWIEERLLKSGKISYYKCWNIATCLNTVVDGFRYDFGTGGLHGSIESTVVESNEDVQIIDWDVASYYPNLAIKNRVFPEHLGERFCDIYEDVYNQRKSYAKGTPENAVMKLALNGTYGASNDKFSPFYDPLFTMKITVNGQLSLCMLVEKLLETEGNKVIQLNTDGCTLCIIKEHIEEANRWVKWWEDATGLEMEDAYYSRMMIRDVNNYIAEYEDGKLKRKGAYEYDGLGWHQNQSALVVKMAAEHALVHGGDIEDFIRGHDNKYDFMLRTKVPRSSRLVLEDSEGNDIPQQNICRYYIAESDYSLVKIMPPLPDKEDERRMGIDKGWNVKVCNDINQFEWDVNYDYYIQEAKKLVDPLVENS